MPPKNKPRVTRKSRSPEAMRERRLARRDQRARRIISEFKNLANLAVKGRTPGDRNSAIYTIANISIPATHPEALKILDRVVRKEREQQGVLSRAVWAIRKMNYGEGFRSLLWIVDKHPQDRTLCSEAVSAIGSLAGAMEEEQLRQALTALEALKKKSALGTGIMKYIDGSIKELKRRM